MPGPSKFKFCFLELSKKTFSQVFSIHGWLTLRMPNPRIRRADYILSCSPPHSFSFPFTMNHWEMKYTNSVFFIWKRRVVLRSYIMTSRENVLKALFSHSRISSFLIQIFHQERHFFPCVWLLSQSMCHLRMKGRLLKAQFMSNFNSNFFWYKIKNRTST